MSATQTMYLSQNWADSAAITTTSPAGDWDSSTTFVYPDNNFAPWYPYYTPTYWWPYSVERKITLKLSEVEHIRKVCRKDAKLRETMNKLAPCIEVQVDFPGE